MMRGDNDLSVACGVLSTALVATILATQSYAGAFNWTGASTVNGNWATGANWLGAQAPPNNGTAELNFAANTHGNNPSNNIANPLSVRKLTFLNGLPAIHLQGDDILLTGAGAGVFQNSANTATIDNNISWGGGTGETMYLNTTGSGCLVLNGNVSGSSVGTIAIGVGTLTLSSGSITAGSGGALAVGYGDAATLKLQSSGAITADALTLGQYGSVGTLERTGGSLTAGDLVTAGIGTLRINYGGSASVATTFGGGLVQNGAGTLVVVPEHGYLADHEAVGFTDAPTLTNGVVGPWAVRQASGSSTTGDYVTTSGSGPYYLATASYQTTFAADAVVTTSGATITDDTSAYALKHGSGTTTISGGKTLTVASGGIILNGGTISGGTVDLAGQTGFLFAGTDSTCTIASKLKTTSGLVKFGPGKLVLSGASGSALSGGINVGSGVLNVQDSGALGTAGAGSEVMVASGAALELQGGIAVAGKSLYVSGPGQLDGANALGALRNISGENAWTGDVHLLGNTQINSDSGTLTLSGPLSGNYSLTKGGSGTLVLSGDNSALSGTIGVASGTLVAQNAAALGLNGAASGVTVASGAALTLQGGVWIGSKPLILSGTGVSGGGALRNLDGSNSLAGPITLAANTQVNCDAGELTLAGPISGNYSLTKAGSGTLVLSSAPSTFTGTLTVAAGALSVTKMNDSGGSGPLGKSTGAVVLGTSGGEATLLYTGGDATSSKRFSLASGGSGVFDVPYANLALSGIISGAGGLKKEGNGTLTLGGVSTYSGATSVDRGTLAVTGSINSTSDISVAQSATLRVTSSGSGQLPDGAGITLSGGNLSYIGSAASGGELAGELALEPGQSNITAGRTSTGSNTPYLRFASAAAHNVGATATYSSTDAAIQFTASPPPLTDGILGGWSFFGAADFATRDTNSPHEVHVYNGYLAENPGTIASDGTKNLRPTSTSTISSDKTFNSLNLTGAVGISIGSGATLTLDAGGLIANTTSAVSGGTLVGSPDVGSAGGELVINTANDLTISSAIGNKGTAGTALIKTGAKTLTLSGQNTYTGDTFINQGTVEFAPASDLTYGGAVRGAGSMRKSSTSTLTLTHASTLTGDTTVSAGTLRFNVTAGGNVCNSLVLDGGAVEFAAAGDLGTLRVASSSTWRGTGGVLGQTTLAGGTLTIAGTSPAGILTARGGIEVTGAATITGGTLRGTAAGGLTVNALDDLTVASVVADGLDNQSQSAATALVKTGPGMLKLTAQNTFTGGVTLWDGKLEMGHQDALGTGPLTVHGGWLDLHGIGSVTVPSLAGSGGTISTSTGTSTLTIDSGSETATEFAGSIEDGDGTVAMVKSGDGKLTLSGSNSYMGGTTVSGGTLEIASADALPAGGSLTIEAGSVVLTGDLGQAIELSDLVLDGEFASMASGGTQAIGAAVPEPSSFFLAFAAVWSAAIYRRFLSGIGNRRW